MSFIHSGITSSEDFTTKFWTVSGSHYQERHFSWPPFGRTCALLSVQIPISGAFPGCLSTCRQSTKLVCGKTWCRLTSYFLCTPGLIGVWLTLDFLVINPASKSCCKLPSSRLATTTATYMAPGWLLVRLWIQSTVFLGVFSIRVDTTSWRVSLHVVGLNNSRL